MVPQFCLMSRLPKLGMLCDSRDMLTAQYLVIRSADKAGEEEPCRPRNAGRRRT